MWELSKRTLKAHKTLDEMEILALAQNPRGAAPLATNSYLGYANKLTSELA